VGKFSIITSLILIGLPVENDLGILDEYKNKEYCGVATAYVVAKYFETPVTLKEMENYCHWDGKKISMLDVNHALKKAGLLVHPRKLDNIILSNQILPAIALIKKNAQGHFLFIIDSRENIYRCYSWPIGMEYLTEDKLKETIYPIFLDVKYPIQSAVLVQKLVILIIIILLLFGRNRLSPKKTKEA